MTLQKKMTASGTSLVAILGPVALIFLASCSPPGSKKNASMSGKSESADSNGNTVASVSPDTSFKLSIPDSVVNDLADGEIDPGEMKNIVDMVGHRMPESHDLLKVKCDSGETDKVYGFLHLALVPSNSEIFTSSESTDDTPLENAEPTVTTEAATTTPEAAAMELTGKPLKPVSMMQRHWVKMPGVFTPLRCKGNVTVELRYLKSGQSYNLSGHFFSLRQKMRYEGQTDFDFPISGNIVLEMSKVEDGRATVQVVFPDSGDSVSDGEGDDGGSDDALPIDEGEDASVTTGDSEVSEDPATTTDTPAQKKAKKDKVKKNKAKKGKGKKK